MKCELCDKDAKPWKRCEDHYRCDDCGTLEKLCMYCEGVLCDPCHKLRVEKRISEFDGDTGYTPEVVCPHCGFTYTDSWEWSEGERECEDCERKFEMSRYTEVTYSTTKLDS